MMKRYLLLWLFLAASSSLFGQGGVVTTDDYESSVRGAEPSQYGDDAASVLMLMPLQAYQGTFSSLSDFNFSFVSYRRRGYDYRYRTLAVDGISLDDPLTGNLYWNLRTAVNGAPGPVLFSEGLALGARTFGLLGGVRDYQRGAGDLPRRAYAAMMFTDRRFRGGARLGAATGWMKGGWAVAVSGSRRWGRDRHIEGVYTDEWTAYFSAAKKLGTKNTLSAIFLMAPSEQGVRGAATDEAFELTGNPLYNPYWGYQQGRIRSSRVRKSQQPLGLLTWDYTPTDKFKLHTAFSYLGGESSYSALDWYGAPNPSPDYYRYMPSHAANPVVADAVREAWQRNDPQVTQINWDELYYVNRHSGTSPAAYVGGSAVTANRNFQLVSSFDYTCTPKVRLRGGINLRNDRSTRYQRLDDLLGGNYLLDIDSYLIDDEYYGDKLQNDMQHPNRRVSVGEHYGYHYDLNYSSYGAWMLTDLHSDRTAGLFGHFGAQAAQVSFYRDGHYEKELFPGGASLGRSRRLNFTDYLLKGGIGYAFTPSHSLELNAAYGDIAPVAEAVFLSPDYQNRTIADPRPINLLAGEFHYRIAWRALDIALSGYASMTRGESDVRHYYDDLVGEYVNMQVTGIDKLYAGVELGVAVTLSPRWSVRGAASLSQNTYLNDPSAVIFTDKDGGAIAPESSVYWKGYKIGGTPQTVAVGELRYSGSHMWNASVSVNYAGQNYIDISPVRRMRRVCDYAASPEALEALTAQQRFGDATTINLFLSKTFHLGRNNYMTISGSVNNLANRRRIISSGYEPLRLLRTGTGLNRTVAPMDSRYYHAYPRTYYLTLNFRF